jgi:uncharacterized coiled-coil DUF342 family protein
MARYKLTIEGNGLQKRSVDKLVKSLEEMKKGEVSVSVVEDNPPTSRSARFDAAQADAADAASEIESLKDELQEWYDNLPESFQNGEKGEQLQSAIDELESLHDSLDEVANATVDFPGMY